MKLAAAFLIVATVPAFAQTYRCTVDGKVVYQQSRCANGVAVDTSGAGTANTTSPGAIQANREVAQYKRKQRVEEAIANGQIFIGMTAAEVRQSWGNPTSINRTHTANSTSDQWVYGSGAYAYLADGVVTAVQTSTRAASPQKVCPSDREIREWEVELSLHDRRHARSPEALRQLISSAQTCRQGQ
jgi:hypothetical protein